MTSKGLSMGIIEILLKVENNDTVTSLTKKVGMTYSHTHEIVMRCAAAKVLSYEKVGRESRITIEQNVFTPAVKEKMLNLMKVFAE